MNYLTDEQLKQYLSEGYELSKSYDEEEEALQYVSYLKELDKDPSYIVSIVGLYAHLDHYPQVVYKVRTTN